MLVLRAPLGAFIQIGEIVKIAAKDVAGNEVQFVIDAPPWVPIKLTTSAVRVKVRRTRPNP